MSSLPIFLLSAAKHIHHWLREIAYEDMARQALGWVPDDAMIEKKTRTEHPIQLDFRVPSKNRLRWAQRRADQLPH